MDFEKELAILINKYSKENESDTPDFILARYLKDCLANYTETVRSLDAAIRAEDRQLPRAMIDEFDAMRETYDTAEAIARRYGYSIKEE